MDKEALQEIIKDYLKENLSINVSTESVYDYCWDGIRVQVEVCLDGEVISVASDSFQLPTN